MTPMYQRQQAMMIMFLQLGRQLMILIRQRRQLIMTQQVTPLVLVVVKFVVKVKHVVILVSAEVIHVTNDHDVHAMDNKRT